MVPKLVSSCHRTWRYSSTAIHRDLFNTGIKTSILTIPSEVSKVSHNTTVWSSWSAVISLKNYKGQKNQNWCSFSSEGMSNRCENFQSNQLRVTHYRFKKCKLRHTRYCYQLIQLASNTRANLHKLHVSVGLGLLYTAYHVYNNASDAGRCGIHGVMCTIKLDVLQHFFWHHVLGTQWW